LLEFLLQSVDDIGSSLLHQFQNIFTNIFYQSPFFSNNLLIRTAWH